MLNLVSNSTMSFKVASRQKNTNMHMCPSFRGGGGVIDDTLDLEKFNLERVDLLF